MGFLVDERLGCQDDEDIDEELERDASSETDHDDDADTDALRFESVNLCGSRSEEGDDGAIAADPQCISPVSQPPRRLRERQRAECGARARAGVPEGPAAMAWWSSSGPAVGEVSASSSSKTLTSGRRE